MPLSDEEIIALLKIKSTERVLDIGGSAKQHRQIRVDTLVDITHPSKKTYNPTQLTAKKFVKADINQETLPFKDNEFDVCLCTHTLEDLYNPFLVLSEMSRVAKRGYIATPSRGKDSEFGTYDLTNAGMGASRQPGLAHHYWLFEDKAGVMKITTKNYPILYAREFQMTKWSGPDEFQFAWRNRIKYKAFQTDSYHALIDNYRRFYRQNAKYIKRGLTTIYVDRPDYILKEYLKKMLGRGNSYKFSKEKSQ